jgi:hypothetical protein
MAHPPPTISETKRGLTAWKLIVLLQVKVIEGLRNGGMNRGRRDLMIGSQDRGIFKYKIVSDVALSPFFWELGTLRV